MNLVLENFDVNGVDMGIDQAIGPGPLPLQLLLFCERVLTHRSVRDSAAERANPHSSAEVRPSIVDPFPWLPPTVDLLEWREGSALSFRQE